MNLCNKIADANVTFHWQERKLFIFYLIPGIVINQDILSEGDTYLPTYVLILF